MSDKNTVAQFDGLWIGETMGAEMPAHLWEIRQQGSNLTIKTRWESETRTIEFKAHVPTGENRFIFQMIKDVTAILVDAEHFVVPKWCTNNTRAGHGPDLDVVFSRPGLPELTARRAWRKYMERGDKGSTALPGDR